MLFERTENGGGVGGAIYVQWRIHARNRLPKGKTMKNTIIRGTEKYPVALDCLIRKAIVTIVGH